MSRVLRKAAAIFSLFALVLVVMVAAACASSPSTSPDESGSYIVNNVADDDSPLRLSSWSEFDKYWEQTDEGDASYAESCSDGSSAFFRLRDGFEAGSSGVDELSLLMGAQAVDSGELDSSWDLAVIDCSTGETTLWLLAPEVRERLEEAGAVFSESELVPFGGRWVAYGNPPSYAEGTWVVEAPLGHYTEDELRELDVIDFGSARESRKLRIAADALHDDELLRMLLESYGEDVVQEWLDKAMEQGDEE